MLGSRFNPEMRVHWAKAFIATILLLRYQLKVLQCLNDAACAPFGGLRSASNSSGSLTHRGFSQ